MLDTPTLSSGGRQTDPHSVTSAETDVRTGALGLVL